MASYKCATILIIAICLCISHLSSSLDTIIKGKKECPEAIHNTTDDIRRVLKGGAAVGARAFSGGAHGFSGGARSSSGGHGYSSERGGHSSRMTIPVAAAAAAGAAAAGAAAAAVASASSNNNHHPKNSSSICMGSDLLGTSLLAVVLSSFAILSKLS